MDVEIESLLKSLGLTEYEAKAWLTLLRHGTLRAEEISDVGGIPLPRVYDTVSELQKKGVVLISKGRPKMFKAIPVKKALNNFADIQKKQAEEKIKAFKENISSVVKALSSIKTIKRPEEKWTIWSTEKRKNVQKFIEEQEKLAKKEILIFSGDMSWLPDRIKSIRQIVKNGVKVKVIMRDPQGSQKIINNIKRAKQIGIEIRVGYDSLLRGSIIDNKIAAVAVKTFKGTEATGTAGTDIEHSYELMILNNPALVNAFKENFEFWWAKLK